MRIPKREIPNLTQALTNIKWNDLLIHEHASDNCNTFMTVLQETMATFLKIKGKPSKKNHLPWLNEDLWTLMKRRDHALKVWLKTKRISDRQIFTSLRNKVVKELRSAKANFFIKMISDARGNTKEIWSSIKKLSGNYTIHKVIKELQMEEKTITDPKDIATALNNYFVDSVEDLVQSSNPQMPLFLKNATKH